MYVVLVNQSIKHNTMWDNSSLFASINGNYRLETDVVEVVALIEFVLE